MSVQQVDENGVPRRRKLSLDIESASKAVDLRPAVWTTPSHQPTLSEAKVTFQPNGAPTAEKTKKKTKKRKKRQEGKGDVSPKTPTVTEPKLPFRERYLSWRYAMALLFQTSFVVAMFLRNNMPVALVCMAKPPSPASSLPNGSDVNASGMTSGMKNNFTSSIIAHEESPETTYEFDWDGQIQSLLLTSTILLSFSGPLIGNAFRTCIDSKKLLTLGTACSGLLTLLCPVAARISPYCLAALRVVMGIMFGFNVPAVGDSLSWWAPQEEKLTMVSISFMGINIGGILSSFFSGFLCSIPVDNGWPFIFYVFGGAALLWDISWHFLSTQKPEDHPFISDKEKEYIIAHRAGLDDSDEKKKEKPPYGKILRSVPVLAFLTAGCSQLWVVNILLAYLPIYFVDVLGFSVQEAGVLISVAVMARMLGAVVWTAIGNYLSTRISNHRSRKICLVTGLLSAGIALVGMSFFDRSNRWIAYTILMASSMAQSVGSSTLTAIPLDMAPRYGGLLTGLFISTGSLFTVTGPPIVSILTPHNAYSEWRLVITLMGAVDIVGGIVFAILGNATIQPWAKVHRKSMPEIASPFVTMGRRISTFVERPPVTPVSPVPPNYDASEGPEDGEVIVTDRRFDFSVRVQVPPSSPSRNGAQQSPGPVGDADGYFGNFRLSNPVSGDANSVEQGVEDGVHTSGLDNEAFEDDEDESGSESGDGGEEERTKADDDESNAAINKDANLPKLKRAFSEYGMEVSRLPLNVQNDMGSKMDEIHLNDENEIPGRRRKVGVIHRPTELPKSTEDSAVSGSSGSCEKQIGNEMSRESLPNVGAETVQTKSEAVANADRNLNVNDGEGGEKLPPDGDTFISVRL